MSGHLLETLSGLMWAPVCWCFNVPEGFPMHHCHWAWKAPPSLGVTGRAGFALPQVNAPHPATGELDWQVMYKLYTQINWLNKHFIMIYFQTYTRESGYTIIIWINFMEVLYTQEGLTSWSLSSEEDCGHPPGVVAHLSDGTPAPSLCQQPLIHVSSKSWLRTSPWRHSDIFAGPAPALMEPLVWGGDGCKHELQAHLSCCLSIILGRALNVSAECCGLTW